MGIPFDVGHTGLCVGSVLRSLQELSKGCATAAGRGSGSQDKHAIEEVFVATSISLRVLFIKGLRRPQGRFEVDWRAELL
jgi:hypothetical protein